MRRIGGLRLEEERSEFRDTTSRRSARSIKSGVSAKSERVPEDFRIPPRIVHVFTKMDEFLKPDLYDIYDKNLELVRTLTE